MKVIKPFFLGLLGGLALSLVLLVGLYFTPLREPLYFRADPEMADVRGKLAQYQDWLSQADLYIQEKGAATSDSLQTAQGLAWREYKKWRTHLGELAHAHSEPTAEGILTWTYSLRYWAGPMAIFLTLFPAFLFAWRSRSRFSVGRIPRGLTGKGKAKTKAQSQAMSSFEDAIKKVARISDTERNASGSSTAASQSAHSSRAYDDEPPTTPMPFTDFGDGSDEHENRHPSKYGQPAQPTQGKDPDTKPFAIVSDTGLETNFLQTGPVWGEPVNAVPSDNVLGNSLGNSLGNTGAGGAGSGQAGLSMEDEDGESDEDDLRGAMPATTEVERVERRKAEVLKLARKGMTSSEISRRMRISQDQVEFIIRLRREKG